MLRLFDHLSEELILEIFNKTSRADQARLARVCKQFNRLANDPFLALDQYKKQKLEEELGNALFTAVANNKTKDVERLLNEGASPNAQHEFYGSPLHVACMKGHNNVAAILLSRGAKTDSKNTMGRTPIDIARRNDNQPLVNMLQKTEENTSQPTSGNDSAPSKCNIM